jgi:hypothetical protein
MMSGVSGAIQTRQLSHLNGSDWKKGIGRERGRESEREREKEKKVSPADEYGPVALGVLYGLGCA